MATLKLTAIGTLSPLGVVTMAQGRAGGDSMSARATSCTQIETPDGGLQPNPWRYDPDFAEKMARADDKSLGAIATHCMSSRGDRVGLDLKKSWFWRSS